MAKWKLSRQKFGNEEFELADGEITVGRGLNNFIKLSSIVISRNHCSFHVKADEIFITDLKSSNGVYVGQEKITPNTPFKLTDNDVIGFGWTIEAPLGNIKDDEKHVYKLIKYPKTQLKRKLSHESLSSEIEENNDEVQRNFNIIATIENSNVKEYDNSNAKKVKKDPILIDLTEEENEDFEYKVFKDKQDYVMINDEIEQILSDSDFESEQLLERLSQNPPNKPLKKLEGTVEKSKKLKENGFGSRTDDDLDEIYEVNDVNCLEMCISPQNLPPNELGDNIPNMPLSIEIVKDLNDNNDSGSDKNPQDLEKKALSVIPLENSNKSLISNQMIEPPNKAFKNPSLAIDEKSKLKKLKTSRKKQSKSSIKPTLTMSQKEERRNKIKKIALKEQEKKTTNSEIIANTTIQEINKNNITEKNNLNSESLHCNASEHQKIQNDAKTKYIPRPRKTLKVISPLHQIPTKNRIAHTKKPLLETSKSNVTSPKKIEKKVSFSNASSEIRTFEIESDIKMRSIKSIKRENRHLIDVPKTNVSIKREALKKIISWNTQWLEVQTKTEQLPPILDKENQLILFLSFRDHEQYVGQVGNLLYLEIWECITQGYKENNRRELNLKIETLPQKPLAQCSDLSTISVKLAISTSDLKRLPRNGDIMMIKSASHDSVPWRFCFVYNVIYLSTSANYKTYSLYLYVKYSTKIEGFNIGEVILGCNLANIHNELSLFEAMEHLAGSPLKETILRPEQSHYPNIEHTDTNNTKSKWTATLNPSQLRAVRESVSAALHSAPALRMVQGPPGTGKSSVICAIVMSYFYDGTTGRKQRNRGKILICAKSNAAVDELVIRLLNMREKLPPEEWFRMVRVGRPEAMHGRARDISSQTLAQRERTRNREETDPGLQQEIALCQAQVNRWKTEKTDDPARAAHCQDRAAHFARQIELLRGGEPSPRQLVAEERLLVGHADVIATTLTSALNHKMQSVKGVELCIVDEAGQAIEPEALLPLSLGVTKLTLVGDPQQLPGYICSQRARKYGLDRSLFSRLSSYSEGWERRPMVLLDRQYRMHPAIADYPNRAFYAGKVQSVPPAPVRLDVPPYCILAISDNKREDACCEARGASRVAHALALAAREHEPRLSVAVITPYVAHRDLIRTYLGDLMRESRTPVEVNTVDSFQGQERDVVVVSLGRRRGVGFLSDAGRMNVLLTRARHVLVVCLDPEAVEEHAQWKTLVEDAKTKKLFKTLPRSMCRQPSSSRPIPPEEVLKFLKSKQTH